MAAGPRAPAGEVGGRCGRRAIGAGTAGGEVPVSVFVQSRGAETFVSRNDTGGCGSGGAAG
ncbi:MAG: hypothetical protein NTW87_15990, partial [Planctomycetota bacterium]|nr:hypothetical protein [Planctomycetota bacterium]